MADNLIEFPDGGRATLVRRYAPPLTRRQLDILLHCPYDSPGHFVKYDRPLRLLVELKLLERNPDNKVEFRVTEAGQQVVHLWVSAGWAP